ncbi:hypothetical protein [Fangia hongkongensis]|uniref:hypothetical protein n=1 Tax=Fangia hongkongensis TaxID=270495 RepID=UPI00037AD981|nr:hypothetical protein [Fangia hongkongensis]MBK2124030.1 hypothetical protein [Fangia hongkongensis]
MEKKIFFTTVAFCAFGIASAHQRNVVIKVDNKLGEKVYALITATGSVAVSQYCQDSQTNKIGGSGYKLNGKLVTEGYEVQEDSDTSPADVNPFSIKIHAESNQVVDNTCSYLKFSLSSSGDSPLMECGLLYKSHKLRLENCYDSQGNLYNADDGVYVFNGPISQG